jgi:LEA14-like dessication related protein
MRNISLAIFSVLIILLSACGKIQEPQFKKLENFKVKKLGLQETTIGFNATYHNPNGFGVAVKETMLDVYLDSVYLGKFNQPLEVAVQRNADFSIPLEGKLSLMDAINANVTSLIGKEVLVKANGTIKVGKAGAFITKDINYQGRHLLDNNLLR